jgi:hypothetical protein
MAQQLSVTLGSEDAEALIQALDEQRVAYETLLSSLNVGVEVFTTILLPTSLAAVQVLATFLTARRAAKLDRKSEPDVQSAPTIRIGHMMIGDRNFSVELIEEKLGRPLNDD